MKLQVVLECDVWGCHRQINHTGEVAVTEEENDYLMEYVGDLPSGWTKHEGDLRCPDHKAGT